MWRHNAQHKYTQHNDIQLYGTKHKGLICDIQHNNIKHNDTLQQLVSLLLTNMLAYYALELNTAAKGLIVQAPDASII
jgi:hypothetical protein